MVLARLRLLHLEIHLAVGVFCGAMSFQSVVAFSVYLFAFNVLAHRSGTKDEDGLETDQDRNGGTCSLGQPVIGSNLSVPVSTCHACIGKGCKWCPLKQTCISHCTLSARASFTQCECDERTPNNPLDNSVKKVENCDRKAPWQEALDELLGKDWATPEKYGKNLDAVRCLQWIHGAKISREGEGPQEKTAEEAGTWGCFSALLRHGMRELYESRPEAEEDHESRPKAREGKTTVMIAGASWHNDRKQFSPKLCELYRQKVKGATCYVRDWKIEEFQRLHDLYPELSQKLYEEIERGPIVTFDPGAGKSGSGFGFLGSKTSGFVVKLGLKYEAKMNEPENFMRLMDPPASGDSVGLVEHFEKNRLSHLNKPFGMLKIAMGSVRSYAVILQQCFYGLDLAAAAEKEQGVSFTRYDLKGSSRNQNEENDEHEFALVNGNFKRRENATMYLTDEQCMNFRKQVAADADFLASHSMIDYSLALVSVKKPTAEQGPHCPGSTEAPLCSEHGNHVYGVSIIDYFNSLNAFKLAESRFRGGKFRNYGKKIKVFTEKICRTAAEKELRSMIKDKLMGKKSMLDIFKEIDTDNSRRVTWGEIVEWLRAQNLDAEKLTMLEETVESLDSSDKSKEGLTSTTFKDVFQYLLD